MNNEGYDKLLERVVNASKIDRGEIERKVEAKRAKLSGLVSKEGALQIVAAELGISLDSERMKIGDVKDGYRRVNVIGKITRIFPVREFNKNGRQGKVGSFSLGDESANTRIVLWDVNHIGLIEKGKLKEGDAVEIRNASAKNGELHLSGFSDVKQSNEAVDNVKTEQVIVGKLSDVKEGLRMKVRAVVVVILVLMVVFRKEVEFGPEKNIMTQGIDPLPLFYSESQSEENEFLSDRMIPRKFDGLGREDDVPQFVKGQIIVKFKRDIGLDLVGDSVVSSDAFISKLIEEHSVFDFREVFPNKEGSILSYTYVIYFPEDKDVVSVVKNFSDFSVVVEYAVNRLPILTKEIFLDGVDVIDDVPDNELIFRGACSRDMRTINWTHFDREMFRDFYRSFTGTVKQRRKILSRERFSKVQADGLLQIVSPLAERC